MVTNVPELTHLATATAVVASVIFIYLSGSEKVLKERMQQRTGHFMPTGLLHSQLETLDEPGDDEGILKIDINTTLDKIIEQIVAFVASEKPVVNSVL